MKSFIDLERVLSGQPPRLGARLATIDTARGREQFSRDQLPKLLEGLAEQTRIASITASNAIEGVLVAGDRAEKLVRATPTRLRNRSEREFAGYRDAIDGIMKARRVESLSVGLILHLHRQLFGHLDLGGGRLKTDQNLIVSYHGDRREIIFTPTPPEQTEFALGELVERYRSATRDQEGHPVLLIGLFVLDLLAIHPVADGNGRLARLLTSQMLMEQGYSVARYVSLEQRIFETKPSYYQSLIDSQRGWHEAAHDPWPWLAYLVEVLEWSYVQFTARVADLATGASKQDRVRGYVLDQAGPSFRIGDIRRALPGVSDPTIRLVLAALKAEGRILARGSGPSACWERLG
jgi:Fic family protein